MTAGLASIEGLGIDAPPGATGTGNSSGELLAAAAGGLATVVQAASQTASHKIRKSLEILEVREYIQALAFAQPSCRRLQISSVAALWFIV